jgi:hypothetical protein
MAKAYEKLATPSFLSSGEMMSAPIQSLSKFWKFVNRFDLKETLTIAIGSPVPARADIRAEPPSPSVSPRPHRDDADHVWSGKFVCL